jgi:outer membrane protein assembly factor BamD
MMPRILEDRSKLLIAALAAALFTGGCLGSGPPKAHVIKEKVAKAPAHASAPTPAPAPAVASNTADTKTSAKSANASKAAANAAAEDTTASAEPDKLLYDRSLLDIKKGRYTEARLSLQALINTYPDSEYLAEAKLAIADSFYKEGGTSNLTQAVEEYKNFIIFFPFLDKASYAQMQVGMAHYRMMEKSDRDSSNAQAAEDDFQTFLLKYPQSPLVPQAEQHLRDIQEVLADGDFKVARFYFIKLDYAAAGARLIEIADRYPLYSHSDDGLWMLSEVYERARQVSKNEDTKNHFADLAAKCYARILTNYPLSSHGPDAKARLVAMGMKVPPADPTALARMQQQQTYEKNHHQFIALRLPREMLHSGPDVSESARSGVPNLAPPSDAISAKDVLSLGSSGPTFSMGVQPTPDSANNNNADTSAGPAEEATQSTTSTDANTSTGVSVQIVNPPDSSAAPATSTPAPTTAPPASAASGAATGNSNPGDSVPLLAPTTAAAPAASAPATSAPAAAPAASSGAPSAAPATAPANPPPASGSQPSSTAQPQTPASSGAQPAASQNGAPANSKAAANSKTDSKSDTKSDSKNESTSKKKKGLKKIVPW